MRVFREDGAVSRRRSRCLVAALGGFWSRTARRSEGRPGTAGVPQRCSGSLGEVIVFCCVREVCTRANAHVGSASASVSASIHVSCGSTSMSVSTYVCIYGGLSSACCLFFFLSHATLCISYLSCLSYESISFSTSVPSVHGVRSFSVRPSPLSPALARSAFARFFVLGVRSFSVRPPVPRPVPRSNSSEY